MIDTYIHFLRYIEQRRLFPVISGNIFNGVCHTGKINFVLFITHNHPILPGKVNVAIQQRQPVSCFLHSRKQQHDIQYRNYYRNCIKYKRTPTTIDVIAHYFLRRSQPHLQKYGKRQLNTQNHL